MDWDSPPETLNQQWCRQMVQALVEAGVGFGIICPGSRNTPIAEALGTQDMIPVYSVVDERGAGFFGLGRIRSLQSPGVITCTSGTAVAELHPAVMEAYHSRVPLIVISADRPGVLQDSGANQAPRQDGMFGSHTRWYRRLPRPRSQNRALESVNEIIHRGVARATGLNSGPVHFNQPLAKPLVPDPEPTSEPPNQDIDPVPEFTSSGFSRVRNTEMNLPRDQAKELSSWLETAERILLVAGPTRYKEQFSELPKLADNLNAPLLADPLSGLRFGSETESIISGYDGIVSGSRNLEHLAPDLILKLGGRMTSKPLRNWLKTVEAKFALIEPVPGNWEDPLFNPKTVYESGVEVLDRLEVNQPNSDPDYLEHWKRAQESFQSAVDSVRSELDGYPESLVLSELASELPGDTGLFVSNSTPVRDFDRFGFHRSEPLTVEANRGCSGIDGLLGTGLGWSADSGSPRVIVLGDVALYHDLNSLMIARRSEIPAVVLVLNNDGGGIFELLPVRDHDPPYESFVRTSHGLNFEAGSEMFDWQYSRVDPEQAVNEVLDNLDSERPVLIETEVDARENREFRARVQTQLKELNE